MELPEPSLLDSNPEYHWVYVGRISARDHDTSLKAITLWSSAFGKPTIKVLEDETYLVDHRILKGVRSEDHWKIYRYSRKP